MSQLETKLRSLKVKKAFLLSNIEMLSEVNEKAYAEFGKVEFDILMLQKEILSKVKNDFED